MFLRKLRYRWRQRCALRLMMLVPPRARSVSRLVLSMASASGVAMPIVPMLNLRLAASSQNAKEWMLVDSTARYQRTPTRPVQFDALM